jgi:hypothetical protein
MSIAPLPGIAVMVAVVLGLPAGLYWLLTRKRRASIQEIRRGAAERGWKFRMRHWTGNPTAFWIEGRSRSGLHVVMKSGAASGYDPGWDATLSLRFSELAGEPDVAILPRRMAHDSGVKLRGISAELQAKVDAFSGLASGVIRLLREGKERPSGFAEFDKTYQVLSLGVSWQPLVDAKLAEKMMAWPVGAVKVHAMLLWRDAFGFHVETRLPAAANWATICYVVGVAEDLCARLPAGKTAEAPKRLVDQVITGILGRR